MPGVLKVSREPMEPVWKQLSPRFPELSSCYWVGIQSCDMFPIQRAVRRWMTGHGRNHCISWGLRDAVAPSQYSPFDRAISNRNYVHKPEKWV